MMLVSQATESRHLVSQAIAMFDVKNKQLFELNEQATSRCGVMTVAFELGNEFPLPSDVPPPFGNMLLGLREVLCGHLAVHA